MPRLSVFFILLCTFFVQNAQAACVKTAKKRVSVNTYYAKADKLVAQALHQSLNSLIKGHKRFKYSPCVWSILLEADVDPRNSANVIGFYTGRSILKSRRVRDGGSKNNWNREHIWALSHGFTRRGQHAYSDVHHIRVADVSVNSDRGNRDFANGGLPHSECTECFVGPAENGGNGTWESPDRIKGDTARMLFYMAVRYDGNDKSRTPDLILLDRQTKVGEARFGKLCSLLQWHKADAVSSEERLRNEVIYTWQGNRNPFIDHPEYAELIWGASCSTGDNGKNTLAPSDKTLILEHIQRIESELKELTNRVMSLP